MSEILTTGRDFIAQLQGSAGTLTINRFVLANISGLDATTPVPLSEAMPAPGDIVYQGAVTAFGYVNPDQVVYSLLLGSDVGDFEFNWVGLRASDDTLVAVRFVPTQSKTKTVGQELGNILNRNFSIGFVDAQALTNITIAAASWQIDVTARLDSETERQRLADREFFGADSFIDAGFEITESGGVFTLVAGSGWVEGLRIVNPSNVVITPGALPKDVWLDVYLQATVTALDAVFDVVFDNGTQNDYVDANGVQHYLVKVVSIDGSGVVTDERTAIDVGGTILEYLIDETVAAQTAAGNAQSTADDAVTDASNANTAAGNAQSTADNAVTDASNANTAAGNAQGKANSNAIDILALQQSLGQMAFKTNTQSVTNSTTLVNDNELDGVLILDANSNYILEGLLIIDQPSTQAGITINLTVPIGATLGYRLSFKNLAGVGISPRDVGMGTLSLTIGQPGNLLHTDTSWTPMQGSIITGSTAGTLGFKFAQSLAQVLPTDIKKGSWLRLTKV